MLIDTSAQRHGSSDTTAAPPRRRHDDAPDTAAAFQRLAALPDGPERDARPRRAGQGVAAHGRSPRRPFPQPR